jgi:DNA-binding transcriptional ArsR family regulator
MSTTAITWALQKAPMPKSDPTARLVLAYLAEKADKHGANSYPQVLSMAHDLTVDPETVTRALKRLRRYGLVSKDGVAGNGAVRYRLHLDQERPDGTFEAFAARHRAGKAARQSRWRSKDVDDDGVSTKTHVDDSRVSTVDDDEASTVDDDQSSRRRRSNVSKTTISRLVDDSNGVQNQEHNHPNRPKNTHAAPPREPALDLPGLAAVAAGPPSEDPSAECGSGYTEAFEVAWEAYGRRGTKKAAFGEWRKAIKRAEPGVITAAIPGYVASTPEIRYRKHMERWLRDDGWESAPVLASSATGGGYQPYRDPSDQSIYDESL